MRASSGRCWPTIGSINAGTLQRLPKRPRSSPADSGTQREFQRNTRHRLHRHLQSGGNQVRPGLMNPARFSGTLRVRGFDQASTSAFHQGPRPSAVHRGRMYGCNLYLGTRAEEGAWQKGASMYEPVFYTSRKDEDPCKSNNLDGRRQRRSDFWTVRDIAVTHNPAVRFTCSGNSSRARRQIRSNYGDGAGKFP